VHVIYGFRLQHAVHIFRLLWCDEEQTVGVINWVNNVLAILAQSNSNSLGYFVSQIIEFGNSPNDIAKEKKS
jgi:ABC-type hemin transport system ATPase subunit